MQVCGYFLVSMILYYDVVSGLLTAGLTNTVPCMTKETHGFSVTNKHTLLRKFWVRNNVQSEDVNVNPRNTLTAKLTSRNSFKGSDDNKQDSMITSLATSLANENDDLKDFDETTTDIYHSTIGLLLLKFQSWLTEGDERLEKIFKYLGYPEEIISIINGSITEILYQERKTKKKMNNLMSAFYYLCDIEHMRDGDDKTDILNIKKTYKYFLKKFNYNEKSVSEMDKTHLVKFLTEKLRSITQKVNSSFGVSITSMKNRILINLSENELINSLKKRFINKNSDMSLYTLAKSFEKETEEWKVANNHLIIIGKLILEVFSFVYNHIDLLSKLRMCDLNDDDMKLIKKFSTFLNLSMSIFVDRYFEFKGKADKEFVYEIFPLVFFFNPSDMGHIPDSSFVASKGGNLLSILDYQDATKRKENEFDIYLWDLLNASLETFLVTFSGEDINEWKNNRWFKINYSEGNHDKEYYLSLMEANTKYAFEILNIFYTNFEV